MTPSKTNIGGEAYVRTKSGNLISASLVKKRELEAKKKRLDQLVGVIKSVQGARGWVSLFLLCLNVSDRRASRVKYEYSQASSCSQQEASGAAENALSFLPEDG